MKKLFIFMTFLFISSVIFAQRDTVADYSDVPIIIDKAENTNDSVILEQYSVSSPAEYIEGERALHVFIGKNVKYPTLAIENEIQGRVIVQFVVEPDSTLSHFQIIGRKLGYGLEEEVIRVMKLTNKNWNPAKSNDKYVRIRMAVPFSYKIK